MTIKACSNCEFWVGRRDVPESLGECRYDAPKVVAVIPMLNQVTRQTEPKAMTCFPNIAGRAWCRQFSETGPEFMAARP